MGVYDSDELVTSRSIIADYSDLIIYLVDGLEMCPVIESSLRKHFIMVVTEQMFDSYLDVDGTIIKKKKNGVPTRIQDPNIGIEYLFYPRSMLDLWKLKELLKKNASEYQSALLELIEMETMSWKVKATDFIKSAHDYMNQDTDEEAEPPRKKIASLDLNIHPSLQNRSDEHGVNNDAEHSEALQLSEDLKNYEKLTPNTWFEVVDQSKTDAEQIRQFWDSSAARRLFPVLSPLSAKLLLLCVPSTSGLERIFSSLTGVKRKDRRRLRSSTQENICICGTPPAALGYIKNL